MSNQMTLTLVTRLYSYRELAPLGQPRNRDTPQIHEKALALADFLGQTSINTTIGAHALLSRRRAKLANYQTKRLLQMGWFIVSSY